VAHPDRICGAVISSAGTYPYPDPAIAWPDGMGPLRWKMRWLGSDKDTVVDIKPNPDGWVKTGGLPITIVVGSNDTEPAYDRNNSQKGVGHVERAKSWFRDMKDLCLKQKQAFHMRLVIVPGADHNSAAAGQMAMRAIGEAIAFNSRRPASRPSSDTTTGTRESK
jgi:hypothetical protein